MPTEPGAPLPFQLIVIPSGNGMPSTMPSGATNIMEINTRSPSGKCSVALKMNVSKSAVANKTKRIRGTSFVNIARAS